MHLRVCSNIFVLLGLVVFLDVVVCAVDSAYARERHLESTRYYGRGNTYVAAYDSDEATRGNPATLCEPDIGWQLRPGQLDFFGGQNTIDTINDASNIFNSVGSDDTTVKVLNELQDKFGKRLYGRGQLMLLSNRIYSFELSPFASTYAFVDPRIPSMPEVSFESETNAGANISFGFPVGSTMSTGITVRPMHQTVFKGDLGFDMLLESLDDGDEGSGGGVELGDLFEKREGMMLGVDWGVIWTASTEWRFGYLIENIGYAAPIGGHKDPPPPIPHRISLGSNYRVALKSFNLDLSMDLQDITNTEDANFLQLWHFGTELGYNLYDRGDNDFGILFGMNDGYFGGGAFVDLWLLRIDLSNYAVEIGEYPGQRMDRRWAMSFKTSMTF